jgi:hypothetical protein
MGTQLIEYSFNGDERAWEEAVQTFLGHIRADPILAAGISYAVFVRDDGKSRLHVPTWKDQDVLERMQAAPFFKVFSGAIRGFAGDTLKVTKPRFAS